MTDRGVSTVVSYVLVLGIVALLTSTLIGAFAPFVTNQHQGTVQSTLEVIGNNLAGDLQSADRLVSNAGQDGNVSLRTRLPDRVGGSPYEIELTQTNPGPTHYQLTLRPQDVDTRAVVQLQTQTQIQERVGSDALDGGALRITYDTQDDELVIQNA